MSETNSTSGRPHKAGGKTFKSRRTKMAMEREADRQQAEKRAPKEPMVDSLDKLFRPKP